MNFVRSLNELHSNVWGVFLIVAGVALSFKNPAVGSTIITGGFALLRPKDDRAVWTDAQRAAMKGAGQDPNPNGNGGQA